MTKKNRWQVDFIDGDHKCIEADDFEIKSGALVFFDWCSDRNIHQRFHVAYGPGCWSTIVPHPDNPVKSSPHPIPQPPLEGPR